MTTEKCMNHIKRRDFKVSPSNLHGTEKLLEKDEGKIDKCSEEEAMVCLYSNHI